MEAGAGRWTGGRARPAAPAVTGPASMFAFHRFVVYRDIRAPNAAVEAVGPIETPERQITPLLEHGEYDATRFRHDRAE